jgi:folate-dependent phosphoribosylglycinamide formyltransferase PurN
MNLRRKKDTMTNKTIVILAGKGSSTNILYNSLKENFEIKKVIIEERESMEIFLKRRIEKFGLSKVIGQVLFKLIIVPLLKIISRKRVLELKGKFNLDNSGIDKSDIINVHSVNSDDTVKILKELNPGLVIVSGTRIISDKVLNNIPAKFINVHAGITPLYRGVHGAYWALVGKDAKNCGVTVHFVDAGIDTGDILGQGIIDPSEDDNFVTYPLLQLAKGIELLKRAVNDVINDRADIKSPPEGQSRLWSHPTVFEYIRNMIIYGVK